MALLHQCWLMCVLQIIALNLSLVYRSFTAVKNNFFIKIILERASFFLLFFSRGISSLLCLYVR